MKIRKKSLFGLLVTILLLGILIPHLFNTIPVTAQSGYIEVYVYDAITLSPIVGGNVILNDDVYTYITDSFTDSSGFVNFTSLSVGTYFVQSFVPGYKENDTFVTIDFEGEGELVEFYQELPYTPGNGFINTYIYDSDTLNPIPGAHIELWNDIGEHIALANADGSGYYNFTGLGPGLYQVYATNESYTSYSVMVTIDFDGEAESVYIYLNPAYVLGVGYIEVYVYDNVSLTPIEDADVTLTDEYDEYVDWGITDSSGFYNFTGLGVGDYYVIGEYTDYSQNSSYIYIDYDGEGEYLMLYLGPIVRTLEILSPTDSQTVEGGMVFVEATASEEIDLRYVEVYVDSAFITNISAYGNIPDFYVPIFENGTNTISLEGYWFDMSTAEDTVVINSINVIPVVNIDEGDYLNYVQYDLVNIHTYEVNYTFTSWLSTFEMETECSVHQYDSGGTIMQTTHDFTVNVLNGYVPVDPSGQFEEQHFYPFSCLPPTPVVGNETVWVPWYSIMTVNGSKTWEYVEVWTLDAGFGEVVTYTEKTSNLLYYLLMPGFMEMFLIGTSIDFLNPSLSDETDFGYIVGETGNTISWDATDMFPDTYSVLHNSAVFVAPTSWDSDTPIVIDVDGLPVGTHTFIITVQDMAGNIATDTVVVIVNAVVPEYGSIIGVLFLSTIMCITLTFALKKKKFQVTK